MTLVDAYGPGSSRATSGGETRQIRIGYGDREMYSRWILTALDRWKQRENEFGVTLLTQTWRLQLSPDWTPSLTATKAVFEKLGVAALKDIPVLESRVCQLENTADEHLLIDRHLYYDNVWIAAGGSGHGHKHGPVVGEYIAQRALGRDPHPGLASVFRLR